VREISDGPSLPSSTRRLQSTGQANGPIGSRHFLLANSRQPALLASSFFSLPSRRDSNYRLHYEHNECLLGTLRMSSEHPYAIINNIPHKTEPCRKMVYLLDYAWSTTSFTCYRTIFPYATQIHQTIPVQTLFPILKSHPYT
jgi:hypothetical protein